MFSKNDDKFIAYMNDEKKRSDYLKNIIAIRKITAILACICIVPIMIIEFDAWYHGQLDGTKFDLLFIVLVCAIFAIQNNEIRFVKYIDKLDTEKDLVNTGNKGSLKNWNNEEPQ